MPCVDILLNRRARHLQSDTRVRRAITAAVDAARAAGANVRVHETTSLEELDRACEALAASDTAAVVLAGGDGSYMAGVTALARAFGDRPLPVLGFAPAGTVSTVARNWSWGRAAERTWGGGTMAHAAARIVRAAGRIGAADVATASRPSLRVTDTRGGSHVGFIFGAGLVASFFDVYDASPHKGYAGAARIVLRIFASSFVAARPAGALARRILTPTACTLVVDGVAQTPHAFSLVAASVVKDLGLHMRLTYRAGEETDRFHAVASPLDAASLGPQMPRVLAGVPLRGDGHVDTLAGELVVEFPREGAYVLDGEVLRAPSVRVRSGPVLTLLR